MLTRLFPLQELIQSPQAFLQPVKRECPRFESIDVCGKYRCCGLQSSWKVLLLLMHASTASNLLAEVLVR